MKEKEIENENNGMGGTPDVVLKRKMSEADAEMRKAEEIYLIEKAAKPLIRIKESHALSLRNNHLAEEVNLSEILQGS